MANQQPNLTAANMDIYSHGTHNVIDAAHACHATVGQFRNACTHRGIETWLCEDGIRRQVHLPQGARNLRIYHNMENP
ncbi:hypothetical protein Tco_1399041 [Tanacetum coccineum]